MLHVPMKPVHPRFYRKGSVHQIDDIVCSHVGDDFIFHFLLATITQVSINDIPILIEYVQPDTPGDFFR